MPRGPGRNQLSALKADIVTGPARNLPHAQSTALDLICRAARAGSPLTHEQLRIRMDDRANVEKHTRHLREQGLVTLDRTVCPPLLRPTPKALS